MELYDLLPDVIESRETRSPVLKIKYPAARRYLQPQAADAWLRQAVRETWSKIFRSVGAARPLMPSITLPIVIPTASLEAPFSAALGTPRLSSASLYTA